MDGSASPSGGVNLSAVKVCPARVQVHVTVLGRLKSIVISFGGSCLGFRGSGSALQFPSPSRDCESRSGPSDRHAISRKGITGAAAAAAQLVSSTNGRILFHNSEKMQRLNRGGCARRLSASSLYERKANGPFMGKLVSKGTIVNIDGEDYVEYRVLTKQSSF
ncbi:hypothetical protein TOPH_07529 [Tolypocladium ophioglossoides CBS 100239]|uniref:Uncharacterized protein n=1 Tax=Tolypocladium ophioglossoides (strain CBS 100239) TaxID=1163406 RepID=A0A0L0N100_TOLOC|nr:hypothetical protein TOPH_07529 [Tolypocladium ophioglossoides CBS 100239]